MTIIRRTFPPKPDLEVKYIDGSKVHIRTDEVAFLHGREAYRAGKPPSVPLVYINHSKSWLDGYNEGKLLSDFIGIFQ